MYFTTRNKCTFNFEYIIPFECKINDNLWGYISYEDSNVNYLKGVFDQYIWSKLIYSSTDDQFKNKTLYNQFSCEDDRIVNDIFFTGNEFQNVNDDDERDYKEEDKVFNAYLTESLDCIQKHKKCVNVAFTIIKKENHPFEMFQKSILLEHLLFYISKKDPGILRPFVMAMYRYFSFDFGMIDHVIKMYTKKHYVSIIPRRHGKTFTIYLVLASFLIAYRTMSILAMAQNKKVINTTKSKVIHFLDYWNKEIEPNSISYSFMSTTDNVLVAYKDDPSNKSLLQCSSAHTDGGSRGPDPQFGIFDETFCFNPLRLNSILALGQKAMCKLGFLSSPTPESKDRIIKFITNVTNVTSGTNFYFINYFCGSSNHSKYSTSQSGCVDLMFYKPHHITFSADNKMLTEIMTRNSQCYEGELGIIKDYEIENAIREEESKLELVEDFKSFNNSFYEHFKTPEIVHYDSDIIDFFIYLDPAFCATSQSGIGIACCGLSKITAIPVLFYFNQRFLEINELTNGNIITIELIFDCIESIRKNLGEKEERLSFFIAIEHNSFLYNVASIYNTLKATFMTNFDVYLYHTEASIVGPKRGEDRMLPGYCMTSNKKNIVNEVLMGCNKRRIKVSAYLPCDKKIKGLHPIPYFLNQCRSFKWIPSRKTWSGKTSRDSSDDLVISAIMSIYFAVLYGKRVEEFKKDIRPPWAPTHRITRV